MKNNVFAVPRLKFSGSPDSLVAKTPVSYYHIFCDPLGQIILEKKYFPTQHHSTRVVESFEKAKRIADDDNITHFSTMLDSPPRICYGCKRVKSALFFSKTCKRCKQCEGLRVAAGMAKVRAKRLKAKLKAADKILGS